MINQSKLKLMDEKDRNKVLAKKGDKLVRIHSNHGMWRPNAKGYTDIGTEAWVLPLREAYEQTEHCGPEKSIIFHYVVDVPEVQPLSCDEDRSAAEIIYTDED